LPLSTEVWVNEMRLTGLDERGGVAALARMDIQLADIGNLTLAGNYSSIGFGAINQKVQQRSRQDIFGYDIASSLELGRLLPDSWKFRIPFYGSLSRTTNTPEFDPYDLDIVLKEKLRDAESPVIRDSLKTQAVETVTLKTMTFTNVRKESGGAEKPMPWDPSNFSVSYAITQSTVSDPLIESDDRKRYNGGLDYRYSRSVNYFEPFKNLIKDDKYLGLIKNFNLNYLPNSFSMRTVMERRFNSSKYRFTGLDDKYSTFYNKKFTWNRDYNLEWDFTKSLKFSFSAMNASVIDEPDELEMAEDPSIINIAEYRKDSIWNNIRNLGRTKNYTHQISLGYTAPIRYLPYMDWVNIRGQYTADFGWTAAALNVDSLGNFIRNSQNLQLSGDFNFESLYNKVPYLRRINRGKGTPELRAPGSRFPTTTPTTPGRQQETSADVPSALERALIRPLMSLRTIRVTYTERYSTSIPGFMPQAKLMGLSPGFEAPGWDFVAGLQPRIRELRDDEYYTSSDWLNNIANKGWISKSVYLNREVIQDYQENLDLRATIEPFRDFRIDLEATRRFTETHTEYFKDTLPDGEAIFTHNIPKKMGSMTVSYSALNTLFKSSRDEIIDLFRTFESNRVTISRRLGTGNHSDPALSELGYTEGYGRTQQDVLIPAFIAAYQGSDPTGIGLNIFEILPRVNWRLTYNGLSKLPLFSEIFQNFSINHSYRASLTVNSFGTGLDFLRTRNEGGLNELNGNFYPRLELPQVGIQEAFSPLISVNATTKNGMTLQVDYNKSRNLGMSFINNQLSETQITEFVIGFGFLLRDVDIPFLTGRGGGGGFNSLFGPETNTNQEPARAGQLRGKDLDMIFNLRLRDDVTYNHLLDQGIIEPTRGNYALIISPSVEYKMNQRLSLRLFFDYNRNVPKTSAGFPRTNTAGGIVVRFALN
jgi:cell surface protein SprA